MKLRMLATLLMTSILIVGCHNDDHGSSSSDTNDTNTTDTNSTDSNETAVSRFSTVSVSGDTVRIDGTTDLQWVGSASGYKSSDAATTEVADVATAVAHCEAITFGGNSDWRAATSTEHATFVKAMEDEGLTPFYDDSTAPRLIGVDDNESKAINTHNTSETGDIVTWSEFLEESSTEYVTKCVRP